MRGIHNAILSNALSSDPRPRRGWRVLPNVLSAVRLAVALALLPIGWLGAGSAHGELAAALVFIAAAATDAVDGWVARRLDAASAFGAQLDLWADKALIAAALAALAMGPAGATGWFWAAAGVILARETWVLWFRRRVRRRGAELPVSRSAKWKTAAQMSACALLLAAGPAEAWFGVGAPAFALGGALLCLSAALSAATAAAYARSAASLDNRANRQHSTTAAAASPAARPSQTPTPPKPNVKPST